MTALSVCGECHADEVLPESCKTNLLTVVPTADGAIRVAYAEWRAMTPDVTNPKYDEASFLKNFTAHLRGCKWQVVEKGEDGIVFLTIDGKTGALVDMGSVE